MFNTGGPGGQNQNKKQKGIRITHIPTGLSSECRELKSQAQNKKRAFLKLGQLIKQHFVQQQYQKANRSTEVVRTYHAVDNRVKDHATGFQQPYSLVVENNYIDDMVTARKNAAG